MTLRSVIEIDEELCDGCGLCVTACAEGAIEIIEDKARLVSDVYCDGLGACLGDCPQGAITVVEREAAEFDEVAVERRLAELAGPGPERPALVGLQLSAPPAPHAAPVGGCPGSRTMSFGAAGPDPAPSEGLEPSRLTHWPIQLHLLSPVAPCYNDADVLLAADCVPFAVGSFHSRFLRDRSLAIACPKLDVNQQVYLDKLVAMIDQARARSLTVVVMEVPCCGGLVQLARQAATAATRSVPITVVTVGVRGQILAEEQVA